MPNQSQIADVIVINHSEAIASFTDCDMKDVKDTLLNRRSIRRYEYDQVTDEQMDFIHEAIRNTPTSYNGQQYSVIDISDQEIKEKIYNLTHQKQIKTCSHFLVFVADYYKISVAAREKGIEVPPFYHTLDGVLVGTIDAALAMMNAVVAAESMGLGTCCVGYTRTVNPVEINKLLNLPLHTYIVCGLAIGVPREIPDLKPKQPMPLVIHKDTYRTEGVDERILDYDAEISHYNETRSGTQTTNDWADHILGYYREAMNYRMLDAIRQQGFDVLQ